MKELRLVKSTSLTDPYIASGDRAYVIGAQDGGFPDMGWHVEGEMGGIWAHPIKLLDGFWLQIDGEWLTNAHRFVGGPFWNAHEYQMADLTLTRTQFIPDGEPACVVRIEMRSSTSCRIPLRFLTRTDLRAVWGSDLEGIANGRDSAVYDSDLGAWRCRDASNPWSVMVGAASLQPCRWECGQALWGPERTAGSGVSVALDYELEVVGGETLQLHLVIAGSHTGEDESLASFVRVCSELEGLERAKARRYGALLAHSHVQIPDPAIVRAWDWLKCNYDWLIRDVPGVGRGLGAGAADYVWWFGCDNGYALLGALALGRHDIAMETLDLLRRLSIEANGSTGRVIHEANTRGFTTGKGCTQETPQFTSTVWQTFRWTGDTDFLHRNYDFCRRGVLEWTLREQAEEQGNSLPFGYGITERLGLDLQCIDSATHTVTALAALAEMAQVVGDEDVAGRCRTLHAELARQVEEAFWMDHEGIYGDMLATPIQMIPRLRAWIESAEVEQNQRAVSELSHLLCEAERSSQQDRKRPWLLKHWVVISPLEHGLTKRDRALRVLERVESPEFTGPYGMYLSGMERTWCMSINTGVLALAEMMQGRVEEGLAYVRLLAESLDVRMPGAISEMSPDGGCFVQAWSGYAVAWPVVAQLFGLQPDAHRKRVTINPRFPADWGEASLTRVLIGGSYFDFVWRHGSLQVGVPDSSWTVESASAGVRCGIGPIL